ncbi:MAG: hypothetical protein ABI813_10450 [Bacteroidota bacterium]
MHQPKQQKSPLLSILVAWLLAGTLDITTALVLFTVRSGKSPLIILKYIASAVFGHSAAYSGGIGMDMAGLLFHYTIAFIFTVLFFLLYPRIHRFINNKYIAGILYGLFVWMVMNLLLVPLTRIPAHAITWQNALENIVILMLAIGLPVSLIAHRYYYGGEK